MALRYSASHRDSCFASVTSQAAEVALAPKSYFSSVIGDDDQGNELCTRSKGSNVGIVPQSNGTSTDPFCAAQKC